MEKYFSQRRSHRRFNGTHIPEELLDRIFRSAMHAPTTGNMQLYSVIVTRDPQRKAELAKLHFNQPASTGSDVLLTVCADFNRFTRWCKLSDADPGYDNFLSFATAMTDAVILTQQIVTLAEMEGLGTCYLGTVNYNADKISELLDLPELVVPVTTIAMGYPSTEGEATERLEPAAWVHNETYRKDTDEEIIELFKVKDEYAPNRKFVEENNKKTLAQVFTDIRYPRSMNEPVSETLLKVIKEKGFMK